MSSDCRRSAFLAHTQPLSRLAIRCTAAVSVVARMVSVAARIAVKSSIIRATRSLEFISDRLLNVTLFELRVGAKAVTLKKNEGI